MRGLAHVPVVLGLLLAGVAVPGAPAYAEAEPVSLVVGLRPGADAGAPVERLEDTTAVDVVESEPVAGTQAVTVDVPTGDVTAAAAALRTDPAVAYVEVDHVATTAAVTADDPFRGRQWALNRTRVAQAWNDTTGAADVVIAVVDTGVSPVGDLAGRVLAGYDFVNNDGNAADDEGHGTMVATTLGGTGDNGLAGAGVCWTCRILPVKALGRDGSGSYSDIAEAVTYAADHGADVINLSLGGSYDSQVLRDAVAHAVAKGALVVAAAGNEGTGAKHYPAAIPAVLAVGASTPTDARYSWSNFGSSWVDVAAPGCTYTQGRTGSVGEFCGTSAATPFVAGIAGLLKSMSPAPTGDQVKTYLTASAVPLTGGWVRHGRVDALAAIGRVPLWVSGVQSRAYVHGDVPVTVHVAASVGPVDTVRITADGNQVGLDSAPPFALSTHLGNLSGAVTLVITASHAGSPVATFSVPVTVDNTAPQLTYKTPGSTSQVRGTVTATAVAADPSGVSRVQLLVNDRLVGTDHIAPYAVSWSTAGTNATAKLTLRAYDKAGNVTSASRWVVTDNTAPLVRVTTGPADGASVNGTVKVGVAAGDARGVARVEALVNGTLVGSYAGSARTFSVPTGPFGRSLRLQVRAYDLAGNVRYAATRTWRS